MDVMMNAPVIDFHIHLAGNTPDALLESMYVAYGSKDNYDAFEKKYADPDAFVELLGQSGVDYGVILAECCPLTCCMASNDEVEKFCAGRKELIPFCTINPHIEPEPTEMLKDLVRNRGFMGLKMYPTYDHFYPNEAKLYPLYAAAQELGVPVLFHTGSSIFKNARIKYGNPIFFDDVAQDFPDLKIVMAHGGRGAWYNEAMTMIRLHRNVYIDAAGLPVRKLPAYFPDIDRFSHKFIFGTDWPQVSAKDSIAKFSEIGLSPDSQSRILGGNAARLLGLS